ncbi:enoyl-CoA hydratase/isomerase family protein [Bradyrhizobium cenepequi]
MHFANVRYEKRDYAALVLFNRPERMNAIGGSMKDDLVGAFEQAERDPEVRVIILSGVGAAFCSGGDLKEIHKSFEQGIERPIEEKVRPSRDRVTLAIYEATKPVIAAVNGAAAGAGMNFALAADMRIASRAAQFSQSLVRRGVHPDCGGTYFLPRLVGPAKASELIFTGATIDAEEALRLGIVSFVVEPRAGSGNLNRAISGVSA